MLPFSDFLSSRTSSGFFIGLSEGAADRCEDSCLGLPCTGFTGAAGSAGVAGQGGVSGRLGGVLPGPFGVTDAGAAVGGFDWGGLVPVLVWVVPEGPELLPPVGNIPHRCTPRKAQRAPPYGGALLCAPAWGQDFCKR